MEKRVFSEELVSNGVVRDASLGLVSVVVRSCLHSGVFEVSEECLVMMQSAVGATCVLIGVSNLDLVLPLRWLERGSPGNYVGGG